MAHDNNLVSYEELIRSVAGNPSQQVLHYGITLPELDEKSKVTKGDSPPDLPLTGSPFAKDSRPITYYYPTEQAVIGTSDERKAIGKYKITNKDELCVNFELNNKAHGLAAFSLSQMLPQVRAKPGYRVRWCDNVASHVVKFGAFFHNKTEVNYFDDITTDSMLDRLKGRDGYASVSQDLGNIPELTTFSDFLPQHPCLFMPPFPFNDDDPSSMFPLHMCSYNDAVTATFSFLRDPQSLLIIAEILRGEDGEEELRVITASPGKRYADFVENGDPITRFSIPNACATYVFMSQDECASNWCVNPNGDPSKGHKPVSFFVNQAIRYHTPNSVAEKNSANITGINTRYPVVRIDWMAQLVGSSERHILSNYTTNPSTDYHNSLTPIASTTISTGKAIIVDDLSGDITTRHNSRFYTRNAPRVPGIHMRSVGIRTGDSTVKPGFYFDKGFLSAKLEERDYAVLNGVRRKYHEEYIVEARVHVRMEFLFTTFPKSEEERVTLEKSILTLVNSGS